MNLPSLSISRGFDTSFITRNLTFAFPIVGVIVSIIVLVMVVWPKFQEAREIQLANRDLVLKSTQLEEKVSKLAGLDKGELEKQLASAEQLLPSDKGTFSVVGQIEGASSSSGILLNRLEVVAASINQDPALAPVVAGGVDPTEAIEGAGAPKVQLKLTASSDYASFLGFLNTLYTSSRVLSVNDLTLSLAAESGAQIRGSFSTNAFWKSLPVTLASIESPVEELNSSELARLSAVSQKQATGQIPTTLVPTVPLGRRDLFAPF